MNSMNRRRALGVVASLLAAATFAPLAAFAAGLTADRDQAKAMVEKAITLFKDKGAEAAISAVNAPDTPFLRGDLYVFIIGPNGRTVAHGFDQSRVGLDVVTLVDQDGTPYGKELLEATAEGIWVNYKWVEPSTGQMEPKSTFAKRVDNYIFGCGVYQQS